MFFSKSPQEDLIFLIEVQSSAVRGSLVLFREGQKPSILFTASAETPLKAGMTSSHMVKATLKAVADAVDVLARHHRAMLEEAKADPHAPAVPKPVSSVHFVLSSPWIISQAKTVSLKLPKETTLTRAKVLEVIEAERSKLSTEETQTEIVEEKIFEVRINGYPVGAWENRLAKEADVSFVVSLSGANLSRRLRESCERLVRKSRVHFHSALLLEAIGIGLAMPEAEDFVLVNVHGELTEVTVVKQRRSVFFGSFPTGVDTIARKVAKAAKTDDRAADSLLSLLSLLSADSIDPTHGKPLQPLVSDIMRGWTSELARLSEGAAGEGALPSQVFVAARRHEEIFMRELAQANPSSQVTPFAMDRLLSQVEFDRYTERRRAIGLVAIAINSLGAK